MPLLWVYNRQPILPMSNIIVYCYSKYDTINKFEIGYMIKPSLNYNKVFRVQVETF